MTGEIAPADHDLAELFRALSSPVRLAIIRILSERERVCGDIVELFHLSQSTVSHHLKTLKESGLVEVEERGTSTCYRLNRARLVELKDLVAAIE